MQRNPQVKQLNETHCASAVATPFHNGSAAELLSFSSTPPLQLAVTLHRPHLKADGQRLMANRLLVALTGVWHILRHVLLLAFVIVYAFAGAKVFSTLELGNEVKEIHNKTATLDRLKGEFFGKINKIYADDRLNMSTRDLQLQDSIQWYEGQLSGPRGNETNWDFLGSLFFCLSIFTTVGYGPYGPHTTEGMCFTIVYGMIGIPLFVALVIDCGTVLFQFYRWLINSCCRGRQCRKVPRWEQIPSLGPTKEVVKPDPFDVPLSLTVCSFILWLIVCTLLVPLWETDWSYFKSFYFSFISMGTVGLGDVQTKQKYMSVIFIFVIFGLSLVALSVFVLQAKVEALFTHLFKVIDNEYKRAQVENFPERMGQTVPREGVVELIKRQPLQERLVALFMDDQKRKFLESRWELKSNIRCKAVQTGSSEFTTGDVHKTPKAVHFQHQHSPEPDTISVGSFVTAVGYLPLSQFGNSHGARAKSPVMTTEIRTRVPSPIAASQEYFSPDGGDADYTLAPQGSFKGQKTKGLAEEDEIYRPGPNVMAQQRQQARLRHQQAIDFNKPVEPEMAKEETNFFPPFKQAPIPAELQEPLINTKKSAFTRPTQLIINGGKVNADRPASSGLLKVAGNNEVAERKVSEENYEYDDYLQPEVKWARPPRKISRELNVQSTDSAALSVPIAAPPPTTLSEAQKAQQPQTFKPIAIGQQIPPARRSPIMMAAGSQQSRSEDRKSGDYNPIDDYLLPEILVERR